MKKRRFKPLKLEDFLEQEEYFADDIPPITPPDIKEKMTNKAANRDNNCHDFEAIYNALLQTVKESNDVSLEAQEKIAKENAKSKRISNKMRRPNV